MKSPRKWIDALLNMRTFGLLRIREYRMLWSAQAFSTMGSWMDEVTRGWLIYELTDSAVQLGLVRGIQAIPFLFFAPIAGSAADRYSRKRQVLIAQSSSAVIYAATAALVFTGAIQPWHVFITAFLGATASAFQQPARASMISDAVPRESLTNAIGLNSLMFNVSRGIGPAIAGVLIVTMGTGGAFTVQAALLACAALLTIPLTSVPHPPRAAGTKRESFVSSILEGFRFSWRDETVRAGLACVMIASFFIVPFTTLLPVFARDLLQVGATGQGLMLTAMGAGAFISAGVIANAGHRLPRGIMMISSGVLYGLAIVLFAASPWYGLSLAAMALAGIFHVYCNVLVQTVVQTYSPQAFRGRTMALFSMHQAVIPLGAMIFGAATEIIGARWTVATMGLAGALCILWLNSAIPRARTIK